MCYLKLSNDIIKWIKNYCDNNNIKSLVVGVSGGIDSALVSTLCAKTNMNVVLVSLPIRQKKDQLTRANTHIELLKSEYNNVSSIEIDLSDVFNTFVSTIPENLRSDLSLANSRSRLRMMSLYQISSNIGGIVVGTGNKIEDFGVGFFTKYGDGGVDISPIADLTKTEVRGMSKLLGISEEIILAQPTDGLWDIERTDEDQLGATYEELEFSMMYDEDPNIIQDRELTNRELEVLGIYKKFNNQNKHKMIEIPIFKK
jgi:NAD+ synthase